MRDTSSRHAAQHRLVPAGVVELMRKQQQGYAYIRP